MWYDSLIVLGMFLLRLVVPILATIAVGYWLEKRLGLEQPESIELREPEKRPVLRPEGAVQIGPAIPCWQLKNCDLSDRVDCPAYAKPSVPCWLANELAYGQLRAECPKCEMYRQHAEVAGRPPLRVIKGRPANDQSAGVG
jgi:hypothetical protein